jgi:uncharacterized protein (DUF2252 family)
MKTKAMGSRKHNKLKTAAVARETDRSPQMWRFVDAHRQIMGHSTKIAPYFGNVLRLTLF